MSEREPSPHRFGNTEKESGNKLLKAPESISSDEVIGLGDKESSFSRDSASTSSKYILGTREGKPYFVVEYYGSLPDELTSDERGLFTRDQRQIDGVKIDVYTLEYGNVPEVSAKERVMETQIPDDYYVARPRKFNDYELGEDQRLSPGRCPP